MRTIDSHFHIWRQVDLAWLVGPMQPRIFGPYEAIRRDYPMAEYRGEAAAAGEGLLCLFPFDLLDAVDGFHHAFVFDAQGETHVAFAAGAEA